jgi:sialic acid synthase SpsE/mannose-6-phosphate isomerase-like protein (cupin superfamily)
MKTKLTQDQFKILKDELEKNEFFTICTAFDENSVQLIKEHDYDVIKIASCSFTDWPLLEAIAKINKPVIASTAGSETEEIDRVANFFLHRGIDLSLMHCVAEYPTKFENLQLNQIDLLKNRYKARVGYSTHESPDNFEAIKIAIGKGAEIFEKHVGVPTETIELNAYSANPEQVEKWLQAAYEGLIMCGIENERYKFTDKEKSDLFALRRGVFVKENIKKGEKIDLSKVYFAFPSVEGQLLANDISKYNEFYITKDSIEKNEPIMLKEVDKVNNEAKVQNEVNNVIAVLKRGNVIIPLNSECEISHHFGIDEFSKCGATIINCVNREYCKKIMVLLPNQSHPTHHHKLKEETFNILYGDLILNLNGEEKIYTPGESVVVERGVAHSFSSKNGCVFEEISTTHYKDDSYYEDMNIKNNKNRKTKVFITKQLLDDYK